jgi:hypothetical protein
LEELRTIARTLMFGLLLLAAALGFGMDALLVLQYRWEQVHGSGDGLGMFFPFMGALVLAPGQIGAAIVIWLRFQRRRERAVALSEVQLQPLAAIPTPDAREYQPMLPPMAASENHVALDIDDRVFERAKARSTRRTALWLLGAPPLGTVLAELAALIGMEFNALVFVAAPCWAVGFVYAAVSLGRYGDWIPLAFALVYPLTGIVIAAR